MKALVGAFVLALFVPALARADVIAPDPVRDACSGKKAADVCEVSGKAGACKTSKCSRKVGGVLNPSVVEEECLVCDATAAAKSAEPTPTPANVDPPKVEPAKVEPAKDEPAKVEPAKDEPAKVEPAKVEPAKSEPAKSEPAKSDAKAESKGGICSVGADATPLASFAMGVLLLALARRRRG